MKWVKIFEQAWSFMKFLFDDPNDPNDFWSKLENAVRDGVILIEETYKLHEGEDWDKRSKAIEVIMGYLEKIGVKFPFSNFILPILIGMLIDALVETLNAVFGKDWIKNIPDLA